MSGLSGGSLPRRTALSLLVGLLGTLRRLLPAVVYGALGAVLVLLGVGIHLLNARPDLRVWHEAELTAEFSAQRPLASFEAYLELERQLFQQTEERVHDRLRPEDRTRFNRYHRGSLADPGRWQRDWNRSFELGLEAPRAGVLLLHGMSDSPYSLRTLGRALHARGAYVVGLRLPGHGTAPSGLLDVRWEDMAAATALAVRHLRERVGRAPLVAIGYSTGAALAVHHAIAALEDGALARLDRLVLISPSIGITPVAALSVWQARLGQILGLPKLAWSSIMPEFDPFKYNSFAVNAGDQVHRLTAGNDAGLARLRRDGRLDAFPAVLAFQSLADATVSTRAVIDRLFLQLLEGGHELVLFDLNRRAAAEDLVSSDPKEAIKSDLVDVALPFALGFVTNEDEQSRGVVLYDKRVGRTKMARRPLGIAWPAGIFSLSHIALPFPESDPLYGGPAAKPSPGIQLGRAELRGERGVLAVSATNLLRLRWNPFYAFLEGRTLEWLGLAER